MKTNYIKKAFTVFSLISVSIALIHLSGCKGSDPGLSKQDLAKALLLANTWKVQSVTVDNADKTSVYKDLTLKFNATSFSTTNGGPVWPASGTWQFTTEEATAVRRDDGLEVQVIEVTESSLKLGLTWSKTTLGRVQSVSGQHVFTFGK